MLESLGLIFPASIVGLRHYCNHLPLYNVLGGQVGYPHAEVHPGLVHSSNDDDSEGDDDMDNDDEDDDEDDDDDDEGAEVSHHIRQPGARILCRVKTQIQLGPGFTSEIFFWYDASAALNEGRPFT